MEKKRAAEKEWIAHTYPKATGPEGGVLTEQLAAGHDGKVLEVRYRGTEVRYAGDVMGREGPPMETIAFASSANGAPAFTDTPQVFAVTKLILGLDGVIATMQPGERRIVIVPAALGYGRAGLYPPEVPGKKRFPSCRRMRSWSTTCKRSPRANRVIGDPALSLACEYRQDVTRGERAGEAKAWSSRKPLANLEYQVHSFRSGLRERHRSVQPIVVEPAEMVGANDRFAGFIPGSAHPVFQSPIKEMRFVRLFVGGLDHGIPKANLGFARESIFATGHGTQNVQEGYAEAVLWKVHLQPTPGILWVARTMTP